MVIVEMSGNQLLADHNNGHEGGSGNGQEQQQLPPAQRPSTVHLPKQQQQQKQKQEQQEAQEFQIGRAHV